MQFPEKTQQEFEQWKRNRYNAKHSNEFDRLPFAFQQGVYTEYFQSVGIEASAPWYSDRWYKYEAVVYCEGEIEFTDKFHNYNDALTAALTAAGQLREQQLHDSATKLP